MSRPPLCVVPRDPASPPPSLTSTELCTSLASTWERWHPVDPALDEMPWLDGDEIDRKVRDLAWLTIERLWDELAEVGKGTGEVVDFAMFPSPIGGFRRRLLRAVDPEGMV
ncbi:MAG: hypothetical protein AAGF11_16320 [Myxococcota bacterium]